MDRTFFTVTGTHERYTFRIDDIRVIERRGTEGKPAGWLDHAEAIVHFDTSGGEIFCVLNEQQWKQLASMLPWEPLGGQHK